MANNFDNQFRSRSDQRSKRRKTNLILNSLIVIVVVLIIVVASTIFYGGRNDEKNASAAKNKVSQHTKNNDKSTTKNNDSQDNKVTDESTNDSNQETNEEANDETKQDLESKDTVVEDSNEPNVKKSYTNPNWKSVGTEQTNGHQYSSDQNSTDWKEKEIALSYATGIPVDNMTIWYLSRNGTDNEVVGTITPKDQSKVYRVYLSWIDGQGWKPTKVLELKENDMR
ncbi:YrrS family protein [Heyndrickxia vini]|uniref:YrrS family protein n=1 Tax=Heyndrickxia vini TaxID=1476025 RepID=A0ABX7E6D2_9BACI|nr:YrrS family protein [Heyndrickxia vini]QQZ10781.1 YrrS family protein [Heyndrickxia vini]